MLYKIEVDLLHLVDEVNKFVTTSKEPILNNRAGFDFSCTFVVGEYDP